MYENVADHHNCFSLHCTDRVLMQPDASGQWYVFRLDDPFEEAVEPISTDRFCFYLFESGAA